RRGLSGTIGLVTVTGGADRGAIARPTTSEAGEAVEAGRLLEQEVASAGTAGPLFAAFAPRAPGIARTRDATSARGASSATRRSTSRELLCLARSSTRRWFSVVRCLADGSR